MNTNQSVLHRDGEFRLIQKLDQLEANIYIVKRSLLKWLIGVAVMVGLEAAIYTFLHFH